MKIYLDPTKYLVVDLNPSVIGLLVVGFSEGGGPEIAELEGSR